MVEVAFGKKKCWASCETWKSFKYGIDSTVRAEGIHSFIASACNKSMSGSELVATLNSYSTRKDFESEIECERKTYATNFKDCYPKPIKDIYKLIGTFPFRTLICQHNQLSYYDCDESGEDGVFLVKRQSSTLCTKSPTREDGMLTKQEALRLEAGIGNCTIFNYRTHKVSIFSCSCKFHISWGLPCRHMLRVHFLYNWKKFECIKNNIIA